MSECFLIIRRQLAFLDANFLATKTKKYIMKDKIRNKHREADMESFERYIYGGSYLADLEAVKDVRDELDTIYRMSEKEHHDIYFAHYRAEMRNKLLSFRPSRNGVIYDMEGRKKTASDFKYDNYCELVYYAANGTDVSPAAYGEIPLSILRIILKKIAVLDDPNKRIMFWKLSKSGIRDKEKVGAIGDLINCDIDVFRYIRADDYSAVQLKAVLDAYQAEKGNLTKESFLYMLTGLRPGITADETYRHFVKEP